MALSVAAGSVAVVGRSPLPPLPLVPRTLRHCFAFTMTQTGTPASSPPDSSASSWSDLCTSLGRDASSPAPAPPRSASQGEPASGGGKKSKASARVFALGDLSKPMCFGRIGESGRFCVKLLPQLEDGTLQTHCGIKIHGSEKFEPVKNTLYPQPNTTTAFCEPCIEESLVPKQKLEELKQTVALSVEDIRRLFTAFEEEWSAKVSGTVLEQKVATRLQFMESNVPFKTPGKVARKRDPPPPRWEPPSLEETKDWEKQGTPEALADHMRLLSLTVAELTAFLQGLRKDLDTTRDDIASDIQNVGIQVKEAASKLGRQEQPIEGLTFPSVWSAVEHLAATEAGPQQLQEMVTALEGELTAASKRLDHAVSTVRDHASQFTALAAWIGNASSLLQPLRALDVAKLDHQVRMLELGLPAGAPPPSPSSAASVDPLLSLLGGKSAPPSPPRQPPVLLGKQNLQCWRNWWRSSKVECRVNR